MEERVKVNFEEALKLNHKIGGYAARITSPKGVKKEVEGKLSYKFHTDGVGNPDDKGFCSVVEGIYQIIDICRWEVNGKLQWNIYLLLVDEDGNTYPVAEYLDNPNTLWVKEAVKIVKAYFNGESLDVIKLTPQPKAKKNPKPKNSFMNPPSAEKPETEPKRKKKTKAKETVTPEIKKPEKPKKKPRARKSEDMEALKYGFARLMTFTGMVIGDYKILRHNKKYIEIETQKGVLRFSKETSKQVDAAKPQFANKIEWNLDKEVK